MSANLSVRARFERFPATLKGAFIIRGEDSDPHQVVLGAARIVPVTGGRGRDVQIADSTLDIAPKRDVFVPFETALTELEPGWYDLECEIEVDGVRRAYPGGRRFAVAWPRASTRRGSISIRRELDVGGLRVRLEQLECAADHARLVARSDPPADLVFALRADGSPVPVLDVDRDERTGTVKVTSYPVMKSQASLRVDVRAGRAAASADVELG